MKATTAPLPHGPMWVYEPKWDGHRGLVRLGSGGFQAVSSNGLARTAQWPWLGDAVSQIDAGDVVLDGEVIALDDTGRHRFELVGSQGHHHALVVFDLLAINGDTIMGLPWSERRERLERLMSPSPSLIMTPVSDDADAMVKATIDGGFEGLIAKNRESRYEQGRRSTLWRKSKHVLSQEMVVGGWTSGLGERRSSFGSLLVGVYDGPTLRFAGAVGSGLDDRSRGQLAPRLKQLVTDRCPFDSVPRIRGRDVVWVNPVIVVQIRLSGWTTAGHIRHPAFHGIREDKDPTQVVREIDLNAKGY